MIEHKGRFSITRQVVKSLMHLNSSTVLILKCFQQWCRLLPPRMNEVVGVSHLKAYIFDDDVLLSGANLGEQYFTCRQVPTVLLV